MARDPKGERSRLHAAAKEGPEQFRAALFSDTSNQLVSERWSVDYSDTTKNLTISARVKTVEPGDVLLQVWLQDIDQKIGFPEWLPWIASVVEFEPDEKMTKAHIGLIDSKWRPEDTGARYKVYLSGHVLHKGEARAFAFEKDFIFPG